MRPTANTLEPQTDPTNAPLRRRYARPPVLEAVIDIHTAGEPEIGVLSALHKGEEERYPSRESLMSASMEIDATIGEAVVATQELIGYRWLSGDKSEVAQVRRNGFGFSQLQPYSSWENSKAEGRRVWERYREATGAIQVSRIAVRYINRIDIPKSAIGQIQDALKVYPQIPDGIPRRMSRFVMQIELPQPDIDKCVVILNMGRVPAAVPNMFSILLDLDVNQRVDLPAEGEAIWEALEILHARENLVFESCITDRTREIFSK
jgi:uncharacterized protein (TIGR04255 family)